MNEQGFHTAFLGGFRKKDVVNFLAEDKQRQTDELEELRRRVETLEQELDRARSDGASVQEMEAQVAEALQGQEEAKNMAEQARQAQTEARAMAQQARRDQQAAQAMAERERQAREEAERRLAESLRDRRQMEEPMGQSIPAPPPAGRYAPPRPERREAFRWQPEAAPELLGEDGVERLWDLCGKLERTLNQMEGLLDGYFQVSFIPQEQARAAQRTAYSGREIPQPRDLMQERGGVGEILQRVRPRK